MTKEKTKDILAKILILGFIFTSIFIFAEGVFANTITHKFKSPSFNGIGTSSHYLTIENQENTRKLTLKEMLIILL